ncbi:MAG: hypothetical protein ACW99G_21275 [Candidatus Thorarchaeota archaeon]
MKVQLDVPVEFTRDTLVQELNRRIVMLEKKLATRDAKITRLTRKLEMIATNEVLLRKLTGMICSLHEESRCEHDYGL